MNNYSNSINLNLLKFFLCAAESNSLSQVADKIEYNPANVSVSITQLEKHNIIINECINCKETTTRINFAKLGVGIAYVIKDSVKEALKNKELYEVKIPIELPTSDISLAFFNNRLTPVDKKFIKDYLQLSI